MKKMLLLADVDREDYWVDGVVFPIPDDIDKYKDAIDYIGEDVVIEKLTEYFSHKLYLRLLEVKRGYFGADFTVRYEYTGAFADGEEYETEFQPNYVWMP